MIRNRLSGVLTAVVAALTPVMAEAAAPPPPPPCLTQGEFAGLVGYALPTVLEAAAQNCPSLPANAYLKANRAAIAAQYTPYKHTIWPVAKIAIMKITASLGSASGGHGADAPNLIAVLPDSALQGLVDAMVPALLSRKMAPRDCALIDHLARLVAPMPAQNTSELFALVVVTEMADKIADISPVRFCPS